MPHLQAELSLHQHSSRRTIVLSARKQGFVRLAIQQGAKLVPIVVFGEAQLLDNPFEIRSAQVPLLREPLPVLFRGAYKISVTVQISCFDGVKMHTVFFVAPLVVISEPKSHCSSSLPGSRFACRDSHTN